MDPIKAQLAEAAALTGDEIELLSRQAADRERLRLLQMRDLAQLKLATEGDDNDKSGT